jgi:hypothetical protein
MLCVSLDSGGLVSFLHDCPREYLKMPACRELP